MLARARVLLLMCFVLGLSSLAHGADLSTVTLSPGPVRESLVGGLPVIETGCFAPGGKLSCASADLDGSGSPGPQDLGMWLQGFFENTEYDEALDYDQDGAVNPADLALLVCLFFSC